MGANTVSQALAIRDEAQYLVTISEVRALAERCEHVGDAKHLSDKARALEIWARRQKLGQEKVALASAAQLWAKRREGELLIEMREKGERRSSGGDYEHGSPKEPSLSDFGISKKESHEAQQLAEIEAERFAEIVDEMVPEGRVNQKEIKRRASRRDREEKIAIEREALEIRALAEIDAQRAGGIEPFEIDVADVQTWRPTGVSAILTDPPYITADALELYSALADFAVDVLPDGGALVALTSGPMLLEVVKAMDRVELAFRSPIALLYENTERTRDGASRTFDGWKPLLVWHKRAMPASAAFFNDVISSPGPAKEHHAWGQSPEVFERLVRAFSKPGDVVCDPFVGGGTTAVAALAATRRFIGCDIDATAVEKSLARLAG